ncbi:MAG: DEAD/DEAH box helicase [Syntrophobacteraceae bacterium]
MPFDELKLAPPLLKALAQCGHTEPTPVQAKAIPAVLSGHDLIASAQTGTGKTGAFVLPALHRLHSELRGRKPGPRVLVLAPTRELATQTTQVARTYGKYLNIHCLAIYGGMPFGDQVRALAQGPEMIVATPGRLIDFIWRGRIDLGHVEMLVLDEADRMLEMGFIEDVEFILDAVPEECQSLLFAATMNEATNTLARKFMKDPERVEIAPGQMTHDNIEQRLHMTDGLQHKNRLLKHLCADESITRAIIFSATKRDADSLAHELNTQGHRAAALHADMTQVARNRTIGNMRQGKIRLLVATDVAARGLDIRGISHVINFDLPRSAEDYVNRIGRTGRAGETGIAISFASRADLPYLDRIERYVGQSLPILVIPGLEPEHPMRRTKGGSKPSKPGNGPGNRSKRSFSENRPNGASAAGNGERTPTKGQPRGPRQDKTVTPEGGRAKPVQASRPRSARPPKKATAGAHKDRTATNPV